MDHGIHYSDAAAPPPQGIVIRPATIADSRLIASLGRQTFVDSFAADNHPDDMAAYLEQAFGPDIQAAELADPSSTFLIARTGSAPSDTRTCARRHNRLASAPPHRSSCHGSMRSRAGSAAAWVRP
jgi:hypothetical protein